ncbi:CCAAT- binding transcription factor component [Marasmius sp. AFHP31]|nr:CCAAT- binding transcription factor component [Marasmius sp. AFHP31]
MSPPQPAPYVQPGDALNDFLRSFWQRQVQEAEQETPDYRHPALPLARIKKVMKSDPDVKQTVRSLLVLVQTACVYDLPSTPFGYPHREAPILFCKACEIFITEITARAFINADSNKRRTLSRSDIAKALAKSDQFDFLIDIVPREDGAGGSGGGKRGKATGDQASSDGHGQGQGSDVIDQLNSLLASQQDGPSS